MNENEAREAAIDRANKRAGLTSNLEDIARCGGMISQYVREKILSEPDLKFVAVPITPGPFPIIIWSARFLDDLHEPLKQALESISEWKASERTVALVFVQNGSFPAHVKNIYLD